MLERTCWVFRTSNKLVVLKLKVILPI